MMAAVMKEVQLCDGHDTCWCFSYQSHLAASQKKWKEEIELEKARSERLVDRLNDLSDIHQDELMAIKQVCLLTTVCCYIQIVVCWILGSNPIVGSCAFIAIQHWTRAGRLYYGA